MDEVFLTGPSTFYAMFERIKKARQTQDPWGNLSIILAGDYCQISPCYDYCLYQKRATGKYIVDEGIKLYHSIKNVLILNENCRQREDLNYFKCVEQIRTRRITQEVVDLLNSRHKSNLPEAEVAEFEDSAIYLYHTRANVNRRNELELARRTIPVVQVEPLLMPRQLKFTTTVDETLYIGRKIPIFLRCNLCVPKALCNGTFGTIEGIFYLPSQVANGGGKLPPPTFITCKFPGYKEITLEDGTIPIFPISYNLEQEGNTTCRVKAFPLSLAYSMTIFKSQSKTLKKVIIYLSKVNDPSLLYVAFSRVQRLQDLVIIGDQFSLDYLPPNQNRNRDMESVRLQALFFNTAYDLLKK